MDLAYGGTAQKNENVYMTTGPDWVMFRWAAETQPVLASGLRAVAAEPRLPEAKLRGYGPGRFSFNVKGGRCESCQGDGLVKIEMHFLPDVYVTCDACRGKRYNRETLKVRFRGLSISEVLELTVEDALETFANQAKMDPITLTDGGEWNTLEKGALLGGVATSYPPVDVSYWRTPPAGVEPELALQA